MLRKRLGLTVTPSRLAIWYLCLVSCLYYLPFIAVAIAAGFMALIVRIIKNIFQQAIDMKAELDLTI